ncbi:MAG TPA: hypothetical protein VF727_17470 [Allosphingosinicella sp.]|jgi:hypothetical protein
MFDFTAFRQSAIAAFAAILFTAAAVGAAVGPAFPSAAPAPVYAQATASDAANV